MSVPVDPYLYLIPGQTVPRPGPRLDTWAYNSSATSRVLLKSVASLLGFNQGLLNKAEGDVPGNPAPCLLPGPTAPRTGPRLDERPCNSSVLGNKSWALTEGLFAKPAASCVCLLTQRWAFQILLWSEQRERIMVFRLCTTRWSKHWSYDVFDLSSCFLTDMISLDFATAPGMPLTNNAVERVVLSFSSLHILHPDLAYSFWSLRDGASSLD